MIAWPPDQGSKDNRWERITLAKGQHWYKKNQGTHLLWIHLCFKRKKISFGGAKIV